MANFKSTFYKRVVLYKDGVLILYAMRISLVPVDQKIDSVYMACIGFIIWWKDLTKR
jgi:hypothetical protein